MKIKNLISGHEIEEMRDMRILPGQTFQFFKQKFIKIMKCRICQSFQNAFQGIKIVLASEKNFRIHLLISLLVILFALYKGLDKIMWIGLLLIIALILALEIFNSAIERLVDMLAPKTHSFAKEVKDLLAAMVLIVVIFAIIIGYILFFA